MEGEARGAVDEEEDKETRSEDQEADSEDEEREKKHGRLNEDRLRRVINRCEVEKALKRTWERKIRRRKARKMALKMTKERKQRKNVNNYAAGNYKME